MSGPDYILDLRNGSSGHEPDKQKSQKAVDRSWLAIRWHCCQVYSRIYHNNDVTAYEGRCPKCARALKVPIGPEGIDARFFDAY